MRIFWIFSFFFTIFLSVRGESFPIAPNCNELELKFSTYTESSPLWDTQALKLYQEGKFKVSNESVFNFGFQSKIFWIAVEARNPFEKQMVCFVHISDPLQDYNEYYEVENDVILPKISFGGRMPNIPNDLNHYHFIHKLNVSPNSSKVILIKTWTRDGNHENIPIYIQSLNELVNSINSENRFNYLVVGMLMSLACFNLILYLYTKNRLFIHYFGFNFFIMTWFSITRRCFFYDLENFDYGIMKRLELISLGLYILSLVAIFRNYFQVRHRKSFVLNFVRFVLVFTLILAVFDYFKITLLTQILSTIPFILYMLIQFFPLYRQNSGYTIQFYIVFLFPVLSGFALIFAMIFNLKTTDVEKIFFASVVIESILFAVIISKSIMKLNLSFEEMNTKKRHVESELYATTERLIQAEKLGTMGSMIAGITHEINNPLQFMDLERLNLQEKNLELYNYLNSFIPDSEETKDFRNRLKKYFGELESSLSSIQSSIKRISQIVTSIKNISRNDDSSFKSNPAEMIDECLIILSHKIKDFIVNKDYQNSKFEIMCKRSQMEQVFMNIISNASDAIYEKLDSVGGSFKGEMKISFLEENEYLRIDFEDNGFGVPLQERERIKEEFYTTKKFGKGTGLGLSISLRILQQHNSELEIGDSESLGGAKFSIKFPYKNQ